MSEIKVLIVDDEQLIRSGMPILLNSHDHIKVVGEAKDGRDALTMAQKVNPDIVLMDIRMPEVNGIEGIKLLKNWNEDIKILMLTTFQDSEYIAKAIKHRASGYLLKDSSHEEIAESIQLVMNGNMIFDGKLGDHLSDQYASAKANDFDMEAYDLSDQEVKIIELIATGLSNQEISEELFLSLGTIKNKITNILQKLHLRDRTQLAIFAFEEGIK